MPIASPTSPTCSDADCRKDFNVKSRTIFEGSHIPLNKSLLATHLILSSKEGLTARQLGRILGFRHYRPAWLMARRIREASQPVLERSSRPCRRLATSAGGARLILRASSPRFARAES
jgi:hypothetical protein